MSPNVPPPTVSTSSRCAGSRSTSGSASGGSWPSGSSDGSATTTWRRSSRTASGFSTYVEGLVKQGIAEGHFDPGLDLGLATDQVFAVLKSSHLLRRPRGTTGVSELAEAYARFIIRGLGDADWNPGVS